MGCAMSEFGTLTTLCSERNGTGFALMDGRERRADEAGPGTICTA